MTAKNRKLIQRYLKEIRDLLAQADVAVRTRVDDELIYGVNLKELLIYLDEEKTSSLICYDWDNVGDQVKLEQEINDFFKNDLIVYKKISIGDKL